MVHGAYFAEKLGPEIRDWMYKTVREKDPNSKLFMNDFDVVANGIYTQVCKRCLFVHHVHQVQA